MEMTSLGKKWLLRDHAIGALFCCRQDHCHKNPDRLWCGIRLMISLVWLALFLPGPAGSQTQATSKIIRYREREASSRYYETYEAKPRP